MYAICKYKRYIYLPQWNQEGISIPPITTVNSFLKSVISLEKVGRSNLGSRKQLGKDYCNSTSHNIIYRHHTIDGTLFKCILTLFFIWMWAVCVASIAHMQDWQEDSNTVGDDPKMDSKSINKLFHCYHGLYLFQAVSTVEMCQQCYFMIDSHAEDF